MSIPLKFMRAHAALLGAYAKTELDLEGANELANAAIGVVVLADDLETQVRIDMLELLVDLVRNRIENADVYKHGWERYRLMDVTNLAIKGAKAWTAEENRSARAA